VAKTERSTVDKYIASQPERVQAALRRVRSTIRKALPTADEVISYKIPAYRVSSGTVLYFAGWKQHYSLYPVGEGLLEKFKEDLEPYEVSKGTIRFPLSEPVPVKLIERIAKFRERETIARTKISKRRTSTSPIRILGGKNNGT
jgi:uncharacterized protein YdhG (YjbR/CyaY superfamily)